MTPAPKRPWFHNRPVWTKALATVIAVVVLGITWPAKLGAHSFVLLGLILVWFPNSRAVSSWLSRGFTSEDSPQFMLSLMGWVFILAMPLLMYYLVAQN